jgi:hypothetical protein
MFFTLFRISKIIACSHKFHVMGIGENNSTDVYFKYFRKEDLMGFERVLFTHDFNSYVILCLLAYNMSIFSEIHFLD